MSLNILSNSNGETLDYLDWKIIVDGIISYAHLDTSKKILSTSPHPKSKGEIEKSFDSIDFFIKKILDSSDRSIMKSIEQISSSTDFFALIDRLEKRAILKIGEINNICLLLEAQRSLMKELQAWVYLDFFNLREFKLQKIINKFIVPFRHFVSTSGNVDYSAHPLLQKTSEQLKELEIKIRNSLSEYSRHKNIKDKLQYSEHDVINDRFVMAVRADSYISSIGNILARSDSGMTLFVEPSHIKAMGDQRIELVNKLNEILIKICIEYSQLIAPYAPSLKNIFEQIIQVDIDLSKSYYSLKNNLTRPTITDRPIIKIENFFHPLINGPVKNSVYLTEKSLGMIISGPNTGGKTVTLKTIAICHLFVQFGLFIPAGAGEIFPFQGIYYFGLDQQNLSNNLSSFSSEVINYITLLKELEPSNLIIIDEIFNSTSSDEASALAYGLLDEIHKKNIAKIIISTHHQLFKTIMHTNDNYSDSHVELNMETNRPTYRLINGLPGSSYALKIFDILAKQEDYISPITTHAEKILDSKHLTYESLLQDVSHKKSQLETLLQQNRTINQELNNQKSAAQGVLKLKMQDEFFQFKNRIEKTLDRARHLTKELKGNKISSTKNSYQQIQHIKEELDQEQQQFHPSPNDSKIGCLVAHHPLPLPPSQIVIDQQYLSLTFKKIVRVKSLNIKKKEALVTCGTISCNLSFSSLRQLKKTPRTSVKINIEKTSDSAIEIDCRGMRLIHFQEIIEKALDDIRLKVTPSVNIIHGHGSGTLKTWLREHLDQQNDIKWKNPSHHDGSTEIYLA